MHYVDIISSAVCVHDVDIIMSSIFAHADELMSYVHTCLVDEKLLELVQGNPRTLKRICNVVTLAVSCFSDKQLSAVGAFQLLLVVIMVEQWPFRSVPKALPVCAEPFPVSTEQLPVSVEDMQVSFRELPSSTVHISIKCYYKSQSFSPMCIQDTG